MIFSAASLHAVLEAHVPQGASGLVVGLSGGLDSACLVTALAQITARPSGAAPPAAKAAEAALWRGLPVRAMHVDHGLQAAAGEFRAACIALCRELGLPLDIVDVSVAIHGVSVEAAARDARYQAFARQLRTGECLLTAHHATDQAETLLIQLLRGAGLKGLSAMPLRRVLGAGWQLRPLLETPQAALRRFAQETGVTAASDPMNHDLRFDRAFLRAQLWPSIEGRWPGATQALARAAQHMADAQELLDRAAAGDVRTLTDGHGLSVTGLRLLSAAQQSNAVRHWLAAAHATLPSTARLTEALRQVLEADADHLPVVTWGGHALRRYRDRVFLTPAILPRVGDPLHWAVDLESSLTLGDGLGTLHWIRQPGGLDAARLPRSVMVRRRRGGEALKAHRLAKTRSVQHLCQSLGVLPWMRDSLPLLFAGETLISIGDLWMDARWCVPDDAAGLGVAWEDAPVLV